MKRGQTPRCRGCRGEQKDGELCLSVTGLYVPYGQAFVVETNFYFCPNVSCISRLPPWTNLKRPQMVHAKASVSDKDIRRLDLGQIGNCYIWPLKLQTRELVCTGAKLER